MDAAAPAAPPAKPAAGGWGAAAAPRPARLAATAHATLGYMRDFTILLEKKIQLLTQSSKNVNVARKEDERATDHENGGELASFSRVSMRSMRSKFIRLERL